MCGIAGVFHASGEPVELPLLRRMTDAIAHRGPDGEGWHRAGPVGLGHRRLAIIDLSDLGRQPMANEAGDIHLTFNGEIYNYRDLRAELKARGWRFRSQTDTEVIVHAYEEWGEDCVRRFNGMFAFGIHDQRRRRLFLARDRFGVKPLYWYHRDGLFLFASEVKAMLQHPRCRRAVCAEALNEYFTFQNTLSDLTFFEGVRLLPAATTLRLDLDTPTQPQVRQYWEYPFPAEPGAAVKDERLVADELYHLFEQAVTRQLVGDVPVGAYLSGGIDSGSITGIAARHVNRLTTFTGGFDLSSASGLELGFDERHSAEVMANLFQTEHYEVVIHAGDMEWAIPGLIWHLEDLRVGQSYPNYYAARLAGKFVKVVLSGVGGDELFAGYPWRYAHGLRSDGAGDYLRRYYRCWQRLVPEEDKAAFFTADTRRRVGDHCTFETFRCVYNGYAGPLCSAEDFVNASLYFELKTFLHGLLVVEDKLSMAHSLESRVPFLDNDLVNFACRLPARFKLRSMRPSATIDENDLGTRQRQVQRSSDGKMILRRAMRGAIPPEVVERTKQGFSAPDASWFRGESINYVRRMLCEPDSRIYEFINPAYVERVVAEHCSGAVNRRLLIWSLLSFEWWLSHFDTGCGSSTAACGAAQMSLNDR